MQKIILRSMDMREFPNLFSLIKLGSMEANNRFVIQPTRRASARGDDGGSGGCPDPQTSRKRNGQIKTYT